MQDKATKALKLLDSGVFKSDICAALRCTAGELDRMLKQIPGTLQKSLHQYMASMNKALRPGIHEIVVNALRSQDEDRIQRVCLALGKTREQLVREICGG